MQLTFHIYGKFWVASYTHLSQGYQGIYSVLWIRFTDSNTLVHGHTPKLALHWNDHEGVFTSMNDNEKKTSAWLNKFFTINI